MLKIKNKLYKSILLLLVSAVTATHAAAWYQDYIPTKWPEGYEPRQLAIRAYQLIPSQVKDQLSYFQTDQSTATVPTPEDPVEAERKLNIQRQQSIESARAKQNQLGMDNQLKEILEKIEKTEPATYTQWLQVKSLINHGANINPIKEKIVKLASMRENKQIEDELKILDTVNGTITLSNILEKIENNGKGTREQWQEVKKLISQGADSNTVTTQENTALDLALKDLTTKSESNEGQGSFLNWRSYLPIN